MIEFFFCTGICILGSFQTLLYFFFLATTAQTQTVELGLEKNKTKRKTNRKNSIQTYTVTSAVLEDTAGPLLGIFRESRTVHEFWETTERHNLFPNTA